MSASLSQREPENGHTRRWIGVCAFLCWLALILPQRELVDINRHRKEWRFFWDLLSQAPLHALGVLLPGIMAVLCAFAFATPRAKVRIFLLAPISAAGVIGMTLMTIQFAIHVPHGELHLGGLGAAALEWALLLAVAFVPAMAHRMRVGLPGRPWLWLVAGAEAAAVLLVVQWLIEDFPHGSNSPFSGVGSLRFGLALAAGAYLLLALWTGFKRSIAGADTVSTASRIALFAYPLVMSAVFLQFVQASDEHAQTFETLVVGMRFFVFVAAQFLASALLIECVFQLRDKTAFDTEAFG